MPAVTYFCPSRIFYCGKTSSSINKTIKIFSLYSVDFFKIVWISLFQFNLSWFIAAGIQTFCRWQNWIYFGSDLQLLAVTLSHSRQSFKGPDQNNTLFRFNVVIDLKIFIPQCTLCFKVKENILINSSTSSYDWLWLCVMSHIYICHE